MVYSGIRRAKEKGPILVNNQQSTKTTKHEIIYIYLDWLPVTEYDRSLAAGCEDEREH